MVLIVRPGPTTPVVVGVGGDVVVYQPDLLVLMLMLI